MSDGPRPKKTIEELRRAVDTRAMKKLNELLARTNIEDEITQIFNDRLEQLVCTTLGFERDSWGSGWTLKDHGEKHGVHRVIRRIVEDLAEKLMPRLLEDKAETFLKDHQTFTNKMKKQARDLFQEFCERDIYTKLKEVIAQKAESAVAAALEEEFKVELRCDVSDLDKDERR